MGGGNQRPSQLGAMLALVGAAVALTASCGGASSSSDDPAGLGRWEGPPPPPAPPRCRWFNTRWGLYFRPGSAAIEPDFQPEPSADPLLRVLEERGRRARARCRLRRALLPVGAQRRGADPRAWAGGDRAAHRTGRPPRRNRTDDRYDRCVLHRCRRRMRSLRAARPPDRRDQLLAMRRHANTDQLNRDSIRSASLVLERQTSRHPVGSDANVCPCHTHALSA